jgi:hypothetical protein
MGSRVKCFLLQFLFLNQINNGYTVYATATATIHIVVSGLYSPEVSSELETRSFRGN